MVAGRIEGGTQLKLIEGDPRPKTYEDAQRFLRSECCTSRIAMEGDCDILNVTCKTFKAVTMDDREVKAKFDLPLNHSGYRESVILEAAQEMWDWKQKTETETGDDENQATETTTCSDACRAEIWIGDEENG